MALVEDFEQEARARSAFGRQPTTSDQVACEKAIADLYERTGRSAPAVIWCKSLYQLLVLPSLLIGMLHNNLWPVLSLLLCEQEQPDDELDSFPRERQSATAMEKMPLPRAGDEDPWDMLWARAGCPLLRGMKRTSRIGESFTEFEPAMILQCKIQLSRWLSSGRLELFEDQLDRQLYRRFWASHLWHQDFAVNLIRLLADKLDHELSREGHFHAREWDQFAPIYGRFRNRYNATARSLLGLASRLGGEPAAQLGQAIWFPFSVPLFALCEIWERHVNPNCFERYRAEITLWSRLAESILSGVFLDQVAFVCEQPPVLRIDEWGRLHDASGPALVFSDGSCDYVWHGVRVEPRVIEDPESITLEEIDSTLNIETRRVLLERFGQARYLEESGAVVVHQDDFGTLYRKELPGDEPLVMVKVVNSTAEPDGSYKDYFLRVPPEIMTARQAVAWTFGLDEADYSPFAES